MHKKEKFRVACVGCGEIAKLHLPVIRKSKYAELAAICDTNVDNLRRVAKEFNIHNYYSDIAELLDKERIDIVHITTPPQTHFALSVRAIEAGCHVLMEKPMALNMDDSDRIIEYAGKNKVKLCIAHNLLFQPVVIKAKSMIDNGAIGSITGMIITHSVPRKSVLVEDENHWCHKLPGGIFGEMLPHALYLAEALLPGLTVASVCYKKLGNVKWLKADEMRVVLENKMGTVVIVESVTGLSDNVNLQIFGTSASLNINIPNGVLTRYTGAKRARLSRGLENIQIGSKLIADTISSAAAIFLKTYQSGHSTLIQKYYESLQYDTDPPVIVEQAHRTMCLYQEITSQI